MDRTIVYFDVVKYSEFTSQKKIKTIETIEKVIAPIKKSKDITIVEAGDAFAFDFDSTQKAIEFALDINLNLNNEDFRLRTGINTGSIEKRKSINGIMNMYGEGIDFAERISTCCNPGQILISKKTVSLIGEKEKINAYISKDYMKYRVKNQYDI
jgi:class 3 adenylate cyclase